MARLILHEAVNVLEKNPKIAEVYDKWYQQRCAVWSTYTTHFPEKEPLSENKNFRDIKNAIIKAASEMQLTEEIVQEVSKAVTENPEQEETLEELIQKIQVEYGGQDEQNQTERTQSTELEQSNWGSLTWLANRIAKVFEDKRPIDEKGNRFDKKMYVRQEEKKRELGMK